MEPKNKQILALTLSIESTMLAVEKFISCMVKIHGKHLVSTDGVT
ncbi:hypothetical protein [Candidatus Nitrosocosmicus sp. R]